jgi:plastocyanin
MRTMQRVTLLAAIVSLALGWALALGLAVGPAVGPAAGQGLAQSADIVDFDYAPKELTVALGTTITWTNKGARPHTVTDRGGTFDSDPILPGATGQVTFGTPGTYHYFCRINPSKMNGLVTVAGTPAATTNRIEALDPALPNESLRFSPGELTVQAGSTILFANVGGKPHTLTADNGSFDTGVVPPGPEGGRFAGSNATVVVKEPGAIPFHCEIHPAAMKGTLTVTGEAARAGPAPPSSAPRTAAVETVDFAFNPAQASVAPGGEVTWTNKGAAPHTATFDDETLDTGRITPGSSGKVTAPLKPGSYSYRCDIHPAKMRGVLVVVGENAQDPAADQAKPAPAAASGGGGPGGRVSALVLVTGVIGAFLGGLGIGAFVRPKRKPKPPAPAPATGEAA